MVSVAVDGDSVPTAGGSEPKARLTVSSLRSSSSSVEMVKVAEPLLEVMLNLPPVRPVTL